MLRSTHFNCVFSPRSYFDLFTTLGCPFIAVSLTRAWLSLIGWLLLDGCLFLFDLAVEFPRVKSGSDDVRWCADLLSFLFSFWFRAASRVILWGKAFANWLLFLFVPLLPRLSFTFLALSAAQLCCLLFSSNTFEGTVCVGGCVAESESVSVSISIWEPSWLRVTVWAWACQGLNGFLRFSFPVVSLISKPRTRLQCNTSYQSGNSSCVTLPFLIILAG